MASIGLSANVEAFAEREFSSSKSPAHEEALSVEDQVLELFSEMRLPIFRHLLWLHLRADQAEDIVQETFLRLYEQLSQAELTRQNLKGWVWRVAHNLGVNVCVATRRKETGTELDLADVSNWLVDPRPNPEQTFSSHQANARVEARVRELSDRDRQCVHLRAQGFGYRQIASMLGMGRSTVADTLDRVTKFLRGQGHS